LGDSFESPGLQRRRVARSRGLDDPQHVRCRARRARATSVRVCGEIAHELLNHRALVRAEGRSGRRAQESGV
jgi:hypothetical protein